METNIIPPVSRALLKAELTEDKFLRKTNKASNEIYIFTAHSSPNLMREVGRLRELSFRDSGGGTGKELDTDEFDYMDKPYVQLIVWDPQEEEILGGYRFIHGSDVTFDKQGQPRLSTAHMYHFTEKFNRHYMPYILELGRSFVQPAYQSSKMGAKSLFALDNLWDGLGALSVVVPDSKYYFGKFTMYPTFNREARNMILYYIKKHFPDHENLIYPIEPLELNIDYPRMNTLFNTGDPLADYKLLNKSVRAHNCNIPPLVSAYVSLSPTMKNFGCAINHEFAEVEETCIMVTIADIFEEKRKRYIESFLKSVPKNVIRLMRNRWIKKKFRRRPKNTGRPQIL